MGTLSVVATPIGNLEDITLRAIRTLTEADTIYAEDTRVTKKLLARYEIETPVRSYPADDRHGKQDQIIETLKNGGHIAVVTDAGTPGISDPGSVLVARIRDTLGDTVTIEAIPGASALTAALSIAGVPIASFCFLGFLPHKKGRETKFAEIAAEKRAVILYESPHRLLKTITSLAEHIPDRTVTIARELTKQFESVVSGTPQELLTHYEEHPDEVRGECVLIISS